MSTQPKLWKSTESGNFAIIFTDGEGRRRRKSLRHADPAKAELDLKHFTRNTFPQVRDASEEKAQGKRSVRLGAMADWYYDIKLVQAKAKPNTIRNYRMCIDGFIRYCSGRNVGTPAQMSSRIIQDWQADKFKDGVARRDDLLCIRRWLAAYKRFHPETKIPKLELDIPPKTRSRRFRAVPEHELYKLLDGLAAYQPEVHRVTLWITLTGWLPSDTLDLRYGQIAGQKIDRERIKTGRRMVLPLTKELSEIIDTERSALDAEPGPDDHVFRRRDGVPWTYPRYMRRLEYFCDTRLTFHVTPRDLRVTYGTMLAEAGCPQHILAELMGHTDVTQALVYYTRVNPNRLRAEAEKHMRKITERVRTPLDMT